jgi:TRAP-type C4-dicarboxylate transport system permease small subunit
MRRIKKAANILDSVNDFMFGAANVLLILVVLGVCTEVFFRFLTGHSLEVIFELTEYSLVWMLFLGTAWLQKRNGHVNMDLVLSRLNPRSRILTSIVTFSLSTIAVGIITWYGVKVTVQDFQMNFLCVSVIQPLKWPIEAIIPIGSFLLLIELMRKTYEYLVSWKMLPRREQKG